MVKSILGLGLASILATACSQSSTPQPASTGAATPAPIPFNGYSNLLKRRFEEAIDLFLAANVGGSGRDALRRLVRVAWDLAQTVTHGDIERVDAFAAAQATVLVVRTLQTLAAIEQMGVERFLAAHVTDGRQ